MTRRLKPGERERREAVIRELWPTKMTLTEIGTELGVSQSMISKIVRDLRDLPPRTILRPKATAEQIAQVRALRNEPMSPEEIAARTGVAPETQKHLAEKFRWPRRKAVDEWTEEDMAALRRMREEGVAAAVIGKRLRRTRHAIHARRYEVGLEPYPAAWKPAHVRIEKERDMMLARGPLTWAQMVAMLDGDKTRAHSLKRYLRARGEIETSGPPKRLIYRALPRKDAPNADDGR